MNKNEAILNKLVEIGQVKVAPYNKHGGDDVVDARTGCFIATKKAFNFLDASENSVVFSALAIESSKRGYMLVIMGNLMVQRPGAMYPENAIIFSAPFSSEAIADAFCKVAGVVYE